MTKAEFVRKVFNTDCESCIIREYCAECRSVSCTSTARKYYESHVDSKGVFQWRETMFNNTQTNTTSQNY